MREIGVDAEIAVSYIRSRLETYARAAAVSESVQAADRGGRNDDGGRS